VADIDRKFGELQKDLLRFANLKVDYNDTADEIYSLREEKYKALTEEAEKKGPKERLKEIGIFFNAQSVIIEDYDEQLVRKLIERITVFADRLTIEFKSSDEIEVKQ